MNVLGLDLESTLCSLTLCEGDLTASVIRRSMGDGRTSLVPIAIGDNGLWGSAALLSAANRRTAFPAASAGLWKDAESFQIFLRSLYDRVYRYLGRVPPAPENGYEVAVSTMRWHDAAQAARLLEAAGFGRVHSVPAPHALLADWLSSERQASGSGVLSVAIGDTSASIALFDISRSGSITHIRAASAESAENIGDAFWRKAVIDELHSRFPEPPRPEWEWLLHEACWRFAQSLTLRHDDTPVQWKDFLGERLAWPLRLARKDIERWPGFGFLNNEIQASVSAMALKLGVPARPSLVLLGGPGARWAFVRSLLEKIAPVWTSAKPGEELSAGCALWRRIEPRLRLEQSLAYVAPPVPASLNAAATQPDPTPGLLPPWKRRERLEENDD